MVRAQAPDPPLTANHKLAIQTPPQRNLGFGGSNANLVIVWLAIGAIAGAQRHYYGSGTSCAKTGTIAVTILAGPLNYVGVNPKVSCKTPHPSK
jgi:hypothetical protein